MAYTINKAEFFSAVGSFIGVVSPSQKTIGAVIALIAGACKSLKEKAKKPDEKAFSLIIGTYFDSIHSVLQTSKYYLNQDLQSKEVKKVLDILLSDLQNRGPQEFDLVELDRQQIMQFELLKYCKDSVSERILQNFSDLNESQADEILKEADHKFKKIFPEELAKENTVVNLLDQIDKINANERIVKYLCRRSQALFYKRIYNDFILGELYVHQTYGIPKYIKGQSKPEIEWKDENTSFEIDRLLKEKNLAILIADMGTGKTSFSKMYAAQLGDQYLANRGDSPRIPIFIELKNFFKKVDDIETDPEDLIIDYMKRIFRFNNVDRNMFFDYPFTIIFDGLDETANLQAMGGIVKVIEHLAGLLNKEEDRDYNLQLLFTSRPVQLSIDVTRELKDYQKNIRHLNRFDETRVGTWLETYFNKIHHDVKKERKFFKEDIFCEDVDKDLQEDIRTPLILYMLARTLNDEKLEISAKEALKGKGKLTRYDIYQKFIDYTVNNAKFQEDPLHRKIDKKKFPSTYRRLLGELAYAIFAHTGGGEGSHQISQKQFESRISFAKLKDDYDFLIRAKCFALAFFQHYRRWDREEAEGRSTEGIGHFEFQHKSFREYLAAERVLCVFIEASLKPIKERQDQYRFLISDRYLTNEKIEFLLFLLDQLVEISEAEEKDILDEKTNVGYSAKRIETLIFDLDINEIKGLAERIYDLAFRWMKDERGIVPGYLIKEKNFEDLKYFELLGDFEGAKVIQETAFIIASHLSRRLKVLSKEKKHFTENDNGWLQRLIDYEFAMRRTSFFYIFRYLTNIYRCKISGYLNNLNLEGADLRGADLEGADLRRADLRGAHLEGADLEGADLRRADLEGADLRGADLEGADLRRADLRGADLWRANLRKANLRGADLEGATFKNAKTNLTVEELKKRGAIVE